MLGPVENTIESPGLLKTEKKSAVPVEDKGSVRVFEDMDDVNEGK